MCTDTPYNKKSFTDDEKKLLVEYYAKAAALTGANARFERMPVSVDACRAYWKECYEDSERTFDDDEDAELGVKVSIPGRSAVFSWNVEDWMDDSETDPSSRAAWEAILDNVAFAWERGLFGIGLIVCGGDTNEGLPISLDGPIEGLSLARSKDGAWRLTSAALPYADPPYNYKGARPRVRVGYSDLEVDEALVASESDAERRDGIIAEGAALIREAANLTQ